MSPLLEVEDVSKHYDRGRSGAFGFGPRTLLRAVDGVSLRIDAGTTLGLVGESGCGKSTLGRLLIRLLPPTGGRITFDGEEISALHGPALKRPRRNMGIVFQDPYGALDPRMTVGAIVREPLLIHGEPADKARIGAMLDRVGLPPSAATRYPHEFSGGQRQRIGIARALIMQPRFLVCDEPVSALDVSVQAGIVNLLQDLQAELGVAMLFIAHDLSVVRHISDRVAVMYLGRVVERGDPDSVFADPAHPYARALIAAIPGSKVERTVLQGDPPDPAARPSGCPFHPRCQLVVARCRVETPDLKPRSRDGRLVACHVAQDEISLGRAA